MAVSRPVRALLAGVVFPILLGLAIVMLFALTPWGNERVRRVIVSRANDRITGQLDIATLRGNLFTGATVTGVRVADSARAPLFTARRAEFRYDVWAALRGRVVLRDIVLDTPYVVLNRPPGGRWNFQSLVRPSSTPRDTTRPRSPLPDIRGSVTIRHGHMVYRRPWRPDSSLSPAARDSVVRRTLRAEARSRTEPVAGGYQRVLEYRDIDARLRDIVLPSGAVPLRVGIADLSMIAAPYRPPEIDVRSLRGVLYAGKDSMWWRGARMTLPASTVTGDGTIGFRRSGFSLDLTGAPVALADLQWLSPKLPSQGGGPLRFAMRINGDTGTYTITGADVRYRDARIAGSAGITRVKPKGGKSRTMIRDADLTVARLTTDILKELAPDVRIPRRGTIDGRLAVTGPRDALLVDADLSFLDAVSGRSRVTAKGGLGFDGGVVARDLAVRVAPLQLGSVAGAGVKLPLTGTVTGAATVSGAPGTGWTVRQGDVTLLERGHRSRVIGDGRYTAGTGAISANARLEPLSLVTVGRFVPDAGLRGAVTGTVRATGTRRAVALNGTLRSTSGGGSVRLAGSVTPNGSRTRYDVRAVLDALNASAFTSKAPSTELTGRVSARGTGFAPATMVATFDAALAGSRYDTFSVERLSARGAVARGLLRLDTLSLAERGARAEASGSLGLVAGRAGALRFALAVDTLGALRRWLGSNDTGIVAPASGRQRVLLAAARADSARRAEEVRIERIALGLPEGVELVRDTLPGIRRDSLAGSLYASGTLTGNVKELGVDATVRGSNLVARGFAARSLSGRVSTPSLKSEAAPLRFALSADEIQARGYGFARIDAEGARTTNNGSRITASLRVVQDSLVRYAALGSYARAASGTHDVRLDSLSAVFDTLVWRLTRPGGVRYSSSLVAIDSVELRSSEGGRLFAHGTVPASGSMRLAVAAENVRVRTVLDAMQRDLPADGALSARANFAGTRAAPVIDGTVTLRDGRYKDDRTPDMDVAARYVAQRLGLQAAAVDSTGRRVLSGTASLPLDLALQKTSGSRKLPGELAADLRLDSLQLAALPLDTRKYTGIRGTVAADATARGTWERPELSARAAVRGGGVLVEETGMRIERAVADLSFARDTLRLDSLLAYAGGPIRARGTVDMTDRSRPFVNMTATGDTVRVMDQLRGVVDANAEVIAYGPLNELRVTGHGEMLGGYLALKQFRKDLLRVKAPGDLSLYAVYDTTAPLGDAERVRLARQVPRKVAIIADLSLTIDRGNYYRNRPATNTEFYTGEGEELRAHLDQRSSDAWAIGFVRMGDAGTAIFRTRLFQTTRGTLTFAPHTDAPGAVQQSGERLVWDASRGWFPVEFRTGGTTKAPAVGMESGTLFPIRGRELNGFLTLGRAGTSLLQQNSSSLSGSSSWSGQLSGEAGALARRQQAATALGVVFYDVGTGATKAYGLDAFTLSPADVPTELVFGKSGGVRGALAEGGKYLTEDLFVAGQLRITSGLPGFRVARRFGTAYRVDLGLEPRFLFRTPEELGITHPTIRTSVFGLLLSRMWEW